MTSNGHKASSGNQDGYQQTFWAEMERLAIRGMDSPEDLTRSEISKLCRLALFAMDLKGNRRTGSIDRFRTTAGH